MGWLNRAALHRPKRVLVIWLIATVALAINGTQLEGHIAPTSIEVPGTASQAAQDLADVEVGARGQAPVLLEGPPEAVREQAERLARALRADPDNRVLSAFDPEAPPQLRPRPGVAAVLVERPTDESFGPEVADAVRRVVTAEVRAPVRASLTGFSAIGGAISEASVSNAHDAEKIAVPILIVILLLVFRSPLAAAIPAVLGGATVLSALGVADLVARMRDVTDVATPLASMMGLALGVDYSLLIVSRFREAQRQGLAVDEAAALAAQTSGRTVVVAGATLLATMVVALLLAPGTFLQSAAVGAASAGVVAVVAALTAVPAALVLIGAHLDRGRIGRPAGDPERGRFAALASAVLRRPVRTGLAAVLVLGVLAVPGVGLDVGPPDVRVLPEDAPVRTDTERVVGALGPGWSAPLELYAVDRVRALDGAGGDRALAGLRSQLTADDGVALVLGPQLTGRTAVVTVVPKSGPNDPQTAALTDRVRTTMREFGSRTGTETAVGGVAAQLTDYRREFDSRLPVLVLALSLVALVALVLVLRAILLPLVAVALNAMVVAAAFGALALLSTGADPVFGGSGFADGLSLLALLALVFGLSLDYQVFILTRLREGWLETGRIDVAIRHAIIRTGPVVLGAAAIMAGVFVAFATSPLQTIKQTGIGLVATVLLAATAVCLVALPAAMRLAGSRTFWLPRRMDALLPSFDLEGTSAPGDVGTPGSVGLVLRTEGEAQVARLQTGPRPAAGLLTSAVEEMFAGVLAARGTIGATLRSTVEHAAPVRPGRELVLVALCEAAVGPRLTLVAEVTDGAMVVARATSTVLVLTPARVPPVAAGTRV